MKQWKNAPETKCHAAQAFYSPAEDSIAMPPREAFVTESEYYATLFHEMVHATGHPSRLGRFCLPDRDSSFGSPDYAFEELVAELGARFLCAEAGIVNECAQNNSSYIAGWLRILRDDRRKLKVAADQAERACDLILGRKPRGRPRKERPPLEEGMPPDAMGRAGFEDGVAAGVGGGEVAVGGPRVAGVSLDPGPTA